MMKSANEELPLQRIVSGGQTGVDRGALDAAIELGIEHGGWCPRGRLAEDGAIPLMYKLEETAATAYAVRTAQNVIDSDGTLILYRDLLSGGTELTRRLALRYDRPLLQIDLKDDPTVQPVRDWLTEHRIVTLNVAGPRESTSPGIEAAAKAFVRLVFENAEP